MGVLIDDDFGSAAEEREPSLRRARITWASAIEPRPVVWAWKDGDAGRIPAGSLSIAAGREGTGKSSFGMWQASHITRGTLPGSLFGAPGSVLYVAMEDSWSYTIVPRLIAAGADLGMVGRFDVVNHEDDEITLSLPHDNDLLEKAINEHGVKLVLIDPIMSVLGDSINASRSREVRRALDPLAKIADRTGCLIQGIAHFNKSSGGDPSSRIQESSAFKDVPRSVFTFAKDDDGRVMTQTKNSLGRDDLPSLGYVIEEAAIPTREGMAFTGRFAFTGESERSVSDLLRDAGGGDDGGERDAVDAWLTDFLGQGQQQTANDVYKAADSAGYSKDQAKRAKKRLHIVATHPDVKGPWYWQMPPREQQGSQGSRVPEDAPLAPLSAPLGLDTLPSTDTESEQEQWPSSIFEDSGDIPRVNIDPHAGHSEAAVSPTIGTVSRVDDASLRLAGASLRPALAVRADCLECTRLQRINAEMLCHQHRDWEAS